MTNVRIAQIATADNVLLAQLLAQRQIIGTVESAAEDEEKRITQEVGALNDLLGQLARGGRKELWGTTRLEVRPESTKQA